MKNLLAITIAVSLLCGCAGSPVAAWNLAESLDKVRSENRRNILKLEVGMAKTQVLQIMGIEEKKLWGGVGFTQRISNPFKSEILNGKDGALEVLYYYTDLQKKDGAITDDELTPIVFENGKVVGWGRSFLDQAIVKYEIRLR